MPQYIFRADLSAESFPFLGSSMPLTTLLRDGQDSGRLSTTSTSNSSNSPAPSTPQTMYMSNCLPSKEGFISAAFNQIVDPQGTDTGFSDRYEIRPPNGKKYQLTVTESLVCYILDFNGTMKWVEVDLPFTITSKDNLSVAYVQGDTYICFPGVGICQLTVTTVGNLASTFALTETTLTAIDMTTVLGCCGSSNYLILWTSDTLYWSSVTTPTDFTPSLTTGANSEQISDLKGTIQFVAQIPQGFLVYSTTNVVSATYTNNLRYPWNMREVPGSAGIDDDKQVSYNENFAEHIAWTNSGLMKLSRIEASLQYPEVSDFLTGRRMESFDFDAGAWTIDYLAANMKCKVNMVSSRYLMISYGEDSLTDVLVYDYSLERWGNLKIDHVDLFEYSAAPWAGVKRYNQMRSIKYESLRTKTYLKARAGERTVGTPKHNICIMKADGSISVLDLSLSNTNRNGVILLGRYQYIRSRLLNIVGVDVSNVDDIVTNYQMKIFASLDGVNIGLTAAPYQITPPANGIRNHLCDITGINHIIAISGAFNLSSVQLTTMLSGRI